MSDTLRDFGAQVREQRERDGWTQEALALRIGISRTYLSHIEQGRAQNLSFRLARELAQFLGIEAPNPDSDTSTIPEPLQAYADSVGLTERDVEMLARIQYRGQRPATEEQWRILHQLIRATIGEPGKKGG